MVLATSDRRGRPSARVVLLKEFGDRGFVFYTNTSSPKARELSANPHAALVFYWERTDRQVRIQGRVKPVSPTEADAYWATRSRFSQLAARASRQSQPLEGRINLLRRFLMGLAKYRGHDIPRPHNWSGYRLSPHKIDFLNRRPSRLVIRELFTKSKNRWKRTWKKTWLQP